MLAITSDSPVVTTFVAVLELSLATRPQLATLRMNIKSHKITNQCHKWLPCGTWFYNDIGRSYAPGLIMTDNK